MVSGDKRRSTKNLEIKKLGYFINICNRGTNTRDQCLPALLYLSGRRIGEVLEVKKQDFIIIPNSIASFKTFNEKVYLSKRLRKYKIKRGKRFYEEITPTFSLESESGKALWPYIENHLKTLDDTHYLFHPYRPYDLDRHIGYGMAYKIIVSLDPDIWPHWFRHQRFSQVAQVFKDDPLTMHRFTYHKRIESTLEYTIKANYDEKLKEV